MISMALGEPYTSIQCFDGPNDSFDCIKFRNTTPSNSSEIRILEVPGIDFPWGDKYSFVNVTTY